MKISRELKYALGSRIRELRFDDQKHLKIELSQLQKLTGIRHDKISDMEIGRSLLDAPSMHKILDTLNCHPSNSSLS